MSQKKFLIHFSHFFTGMGLMHMIGLITFPIITRLLTRDEYGIMALITITMFLAVALAKAGLSDGIIRFYKEYSDTQDRLSIFTSTVFFRGVLFSAIATVLYLSSLPLLKSALNIENKYIICFIVVAAQLFVRPINIIFLNLLRVQEKTVFYNAVNIVGRLVSFGSSIFLLVYIIGEFYGYFVGIVLAEMLTFVVLFFWFIRNFKLKITDISGSLGVSLVKFGYPLLITELSYLLLSYIDRYMIAAYKGGDTLGLYSVGYNLASYVGETITFSLSYAIVPLYVSLYAKEGKESTEDFLNKCMHYLLMAILPIFFGYYLVSKDVFITLASTKYTEAASFSPIILLGTMFLGLNSILNAGLYLQKKSRSILFIMLAALALNIASNIYLIPLYGVMGAAIATLASCVTTTILTVFLSTKHIKVKIDMKVFLYYLVLSASMLLILGRIDMAVVWQDLLVKMLLGSTMIIAGILYREKLIRENVWNMLPFRVKT